MSPMAYYALEGLAVSAALAAFVWALGWLTRKPLPHPMNVDPGPEWYVTPATRINARLTADREEL